MNKDFWHRRDQLPLLLNDMGLVGSCVEVGVLFGHFSENIRRNWNGAKIYCVDRWAYVPGYEDAANMPQAQQDDIYRQACQRMADCSLEGRASEIVRKDSILAAADFARAGLSFDAVYIDGDHAGPAVRADIAAWWPLVKRGGFFGGHDFISTGWHKSGDPFTAYADRKDCPEPANEFGVIDAVLEFVEREKLELHITDKDDCYGWRSWAVIKL